MSVHKILSGIMITAVLIALLCSGYYAWNGGENGYIFLMLSCIFGMNCFNAIMLDELTHTGEDIIAREYKKILDEDKKWQKRHMPPPKKSDEHVEMCGRCD